MQERQPPNLNPWYVLMALFGEQVGEEGDEDLHRRNREAWNLWAGQSLPGVSDSFNDLVWGNNVQGIRIETIFEDANGLGLPDPRFPEKCFPAHTQIQTFRTASTAIYALRTGDIVLA